MVAILASGGIRGLCLYTYIHPKFRGEWTIANRQDGLGWGPCFDLTFFDDSHQMELYWESPVQRRIEDGGKK